MTRQGEKEAAASLFDAGADVVFTGADTPAVADVAQEKGKWGVTYDHPGSCQVDACLTAPYWIWGPEYARIAEQVKAKTYKAGYEYFDADSKAMGLYGFMDGQTPQPGITDLPAERRPDGQGHAGQDAGRSVRPVRRVLRSDQRHDRRRQGPGRLEARSRPISTSSRPARTAIPARTA